MTSLQQAADSAQVSVRTTASSDWDDYIGRRHPQAANRRAGWASLATEVFGFESRFIEARDADGLLVGVLPLVQQKTWLFGSSATSIPYFTYGGPAADSPEIATRLMHEAREVARAWQCKYLEVRDVALRPTDWILRTDKISMVLPLPATFDLLQKALGAKLRSQARRADREAATVRQGGAELVDDFYDVFSRNMQELGTPVYPKRFFSAVMAKFADVCQLVVVYRGEQPAAAGFLVFTGDTAEIPWAACRSDAKPLGFNMKLYWEVLRLVMERGCSSFDFGRSSADSPTHRFKAQWGAQPRQLYWYRWEPNAQPGRDDGAQRGGAMALATSVWKRLPLKVANLLGPLISPGLPW